MGATSGQLNYLYGWKYDANSLIEQEPRVITTLQMNGESALLFLGDFTVTLKMRS